MKTTRYGLATALALTAALLLGAGATGCKKAAKKAAKETAAETTKAAVDPKDEGKPPGKMPPGKRPPGKMPPGAPPDPSKMERISAAHILVAFQGAMRADPKITRTKEEAEKLAKEIAVEAKKDPSKFAEMAKAKSDAPDKDRGGSLGLLPPGLGNHPFAMATKDLKVGEIADPVETPFGFHVLMRQTLPPRYAGAHILVAFKGAMRADAKITRSKEEAKKECATLAVKARKDPSKFAELAKKHSDGPSGVKGGSLGVWHKGMMVPEFDKAISGLEIGGISEPIETPFGFHIIIREDPAKKE